MEQNIGITILVDNTAVRADLQSEHGLSLWIEYRDKRIVFDTGQSDILIKNASKLGIDLARTDAVALSHGHYDHTGGLKAVFDIATKAVLYLHPQAASQKFSRKDGNVRMIGMGDGAKEAIGTLDKDGRVVRTEKPTEIFTGLFVTGGIPRNTDFENTGSAFFADHSCQTADNLPDDQALFFETKQGLAVVLGCGHSGVINTLDYVSRLTGEKHIYAVMGGMHLLNASAERLERTIQALKEYNMQKIGPAHCTGTKAVAQLRAAFGRGFFTCSAGKRVEL